MSANMAELMDSGETAQHSVITDMDMPCYRGIIRNNTVVTH